MRTHVLQLRLKILPAALLLLFSLCTSASFAAQYYSGNTGEPVTFEQVAAKVKKSQIIIVSEYHDNQIHHENQKKWLSTIAGQNITVSVGMEFFSYTHQASVDDYGFGRISEADFLNTIKWGGSTFLVGLKNLMLNSFVRIFNLGGNPFSDYRDQVLFPYAQGGRTVALNFPRELTGKVSQGGLDALTEDEKSLMPPNFTMGRASYFERFSEIMGGHVPLEKLRNYFISQSLWDDTMAWRAVEHMRANPEQSLVIIVGDFHLAYLDGLAARLEARMDESLQARIQESAKDLNDVELLTISQIDTTGLSAEERQAMILPSQKYGRRADFIFDAASGLKQ